MSDVRVNLLPREIQERERARRNFGLLAAAGAAYLALFVVLFFVANNQVSNAEARLAEAEAERTELRAAVSELQPYADLEQRHDDASELLTTTLAGEMSYAGVLQDVAAVMPSDAALTNLSITTSVGEEGAEGQLGTIAGTGETLEGHAPGVERFLLEFDKIAAFSEVFVSSSTTDEQDIATFSFEADLGPEILTGRYVTGLPESLR